MAAGLKINFNGKQILSKNGLLDLLKNKTLNQKLYYPIIYMSDEDIEIAMTHSNSYREDYHAFVNGQHTILGGTHLTASKESIVRTIRDFFNKDFEPSDTINALGFKSSK